MHVSDKLAFHLGDSFYTAIKSVEVVALETNPENWQDDFSKSIFYKTPRNFNPERFGGFVKDGPYDVLRITSFAIDDYEEAMKASLAVEPSMINGMLYRTYGTRTDDFEEDTYLDLYIFQTGRKLGKRLAGVENFEESEKLVMEAYRDMMKDRNNKRKSYDFEGIATNPRKVEDAYRKGDLDMLDSLEALTVESDAFQEKFLYKRNDIQANSIDSIIKKSSLFVAVGAAHLPGRRGVIEILRRKGYILRPVRMDERNSQQKDLIDKTRSPVSFTTQTSDDGFYKVDIPGKKFYQFTDWTGMDVVQYADMVNGAYYMVTRIKTNSLSWGHNTDVIHKRIDSLLYENIPGKILSKTPITKNGYKGWDIHNRTRRGDNQRYNAFITPFEIIVFKISGNGEYINSGDEAEKFFSSIRLKEYDNASWINYQPPTGGFSVQLPHPPSVLKDMNYGSDRLEYAAWDRKDGNSYLIMKTNQHNFSFLEEDTFQLNLMSESYSFSTFINKEISRKFVTVRSYPALDCKYKHKDGSFSSVKYIIRGPVFYVAAVHYKNDNDNVKRFLESFSVTPFIYPDSKPRTDTSLHFTVQSPLALSNGEKDDTYQSMMNLVKMYMDEDDDDDDEYRYTFREFNNAFNSKFIGNDTIGEKILVTYNAPVKYTYIKDSASLWKKRSVPGTFGDDSSFIYQIDKQYSLPGGVWCHELQLADTGTSRVFLIKRFYKDGHMFTLSALTDTVSPRSPFLLQFFSTFTPSDTLKKESLFTRKSEQFITDYFSDDSVVAKKARKYLYTVKFDSLDVPLLKNAIGRVNWNTKNYLSVKKYFITKLAGMKDSSITPFLRDLYWKVKDSAELQNLILESLLRQRTRESFTAFKELILQEPPVAAGSSGFSSYRSGSSVAIREVIEYSGPSRFSTRDYDSRFYGSWYPLYDTLALAKTIFPDILQLGNVDDYKKEVTNLVTVMVDSGFLKAEDYESNFSKYYLDAKQSLKKQVAREEKANIDKASNKEMISRYGWAEDVYDQYTDFGNNELEQYAILLMPFYDKNPALPGFYEQLLKVKDRRLLYDILILMLRNNKPVPDSLFTTYAKLDNYRVKFYKDLQKMKKLEKFPTAWKNQQSIARSLFMTEGYRYQKPDSVVFIDKLAVSYKGKKGWVYFFKYRPMRDDTQWQLASVGMQPENLTEIDVENDEFTEKGERKLESDKPDKEQMQKMLKELLCAKHESAEDFYRARSFNFYKSYLSEMVKRQRYRD
ncbi:MAG TPA: TraB/GumN family protein, partial [Chitinophagaceae bacterium]|nr:TraB/GumN family protein [Chitinophagaceae bacterium]